MAEEGQTLMVVRSPAKAANRIPAGLNRSVGSRSEWSMLDASQGNPGDGATFTGKLESWRQLRKEPRWDCGL